MITLKLSSLFVNNKNLQIINFRTGIEIKRSDSNHNRLLDYRNKPAAGEKIGILPQMLSHFLTQQSGWGGGGCPPELVEIRPHLKKI